MAGASTAGVGTKGTFKQHLASFVQAAQQQSGIQHAASFVTAVVKLQQKLRALSSEMAEGRAGQQTAWPRSHGKPSSTASPAEMGTLFCPQARAAATTLDY